MALTPWPGHADDQWTDGRQFGLRDSATGSETLPVAATPVVSALSPGSILIAQARAGPAEGKDWQVTIAPYFRMTRTKMNLDVGQFSRSTTIDFLDVVPQLHMAFAPISRPRMDPGARARSSRSRWRGSRSGCSCKAARTDASGAPRSAGRGAR